MKKTYLIFRDFFRQVRDKNLSAYSASCAFFLFLSMGPLVAMVGLMMESIDKPVGVLSVATLAMMWAAGKGTLALMRGLNAVHNVKEQRNYFVVRILASVYTVGLVLVIAISLGLIVFSNAMIDMISFYLPRSEVIFTIIAPFRYAIVWLVITMVLTCIYVFLPSIKLRAKGQLPGAMVSAFVWSLFSFGFSVYMDSSDFGVLYGSLSLLVLFLLWLYFGMYIILLGAYLNRYFWKRLSA